MKKNKPKEFSIKFYEGKKRVLEYNYELFKRKKTNDKKETLNSADVIYLITPDRYANGDEKNDEIDLLLEKPNRKNKDGRHGGDLQGIINNLDYIEDMGFTQIWLNPVLENNQPDYSYHGYSTTDYYKIDSRFGSNQLYIELSQQAKKRDIGLIKDLVLNHIDLGTGGWMTCPLMIGLTIKINMYRQTIYMRLFMTHIFLSHKKICLLKDGLLRQCQI